MGMGSMVGWHMHGLFFGGMAVWSVSSVLVRLLPSVSQSVCVYLHSFGHQRDAFD